MEEAMAFATCAFSSVISSLNATMTPPSFLSIAARNAFGRSYILSTVFLFWYAILYFNELAAGK